jgi:hypothetical protein
MSEQEFQGSVCHVYSLGIDKYFNVDMSSLFGIYHGT